MSSFSPVFVPETDFSGIIASLSSVMFHIQLFAITTHIFLVAKCLKCIF